MLTNEMEIAQRLNELWGREEPGFPTVFDCNLLHASFAHVDPSTFDIMVHLRYAHQERPTRVVSLERCLDDLEGFRDYYNKVVNGDLDVPHLAVPPTARINSSSNPLFGSW